MKTNFIKKFMFLTAAVAVSFGMASSTVFAAGAAINTASNDLKTVRVSNYSAQPESMSWGPSVNSAAGQIVAVGIYYHNSGDQTLQNLKIRLSPQTSGAGTNHSFTATLSADNASSKTDSATVNIVGGVAQSVTYIPTAVYWYPNQACATTAGCHPTSLPMGQDGSELFGSGLNLGNIAPGWSTQGGLTVQFKVSSNGGTNGTNPTVVTYAATGLSDSLGAVTLKGFVNPNGNSNISGWFRYRRNNGNWTETAHQSIGSAQNIARSLTGLPGGDYEYQAVATGGHYGDSKFFTLDNNNTCDPCDPCGDDYPCPSGDGEPSVETLSPTNVDENSATLRGKLTDTGNDTNDIYFKWGTSSGNLNHTLNAGTKSSTGTFSKTLNGLDQDETYYYKACAENSNGSDCGSIESFDTDSDGGVCIDYGCNGEDRPSITTLNAVAITTSTAVVDGYYNANGCSVTTYFEYGRTDNLGSVTGSTNRGNGSGSMAYAFTSLAPNTTYYYRAVGSNCEGTSRGVIKSFTTKNGTVIVNPVTPVFVGTGGGSQFIKLMIDNHRSTVRSGTDIVYDVSWENITRSTLKNLVLEINFDDMTALDTDMGDISRDGHSVIVELDTLGSLESGEMSFTTKTTGSLKDGNPVVAQAIMAFENPKTTATENAIAYDSDEFTTRGSTLGASIFGLSLPTTLGGWLLILLIILLIIVIARHFMRQNKTVVMNQASAHPADPAANGATGNDYIVYRPTPKQ
jgi:hypothetical protein